MSEDILRVVGATFAEETGRIYYGLTLTNKKVRIMFENMIQGCFSENSSYNDFVKALLLDEVKARIIPIYLNSRYRIRKKKELSDTVQDVLRQINRAG